MDRMETTKILERTIKELGLEYKSSDLRKIFYWLRDVERDMERVVNSLGGTIIWDYQNMYTCDVCGQLVIKEGYDSPDYYELKEKKICPYCNNTGRTS